MDRIDTISKKAEDGSLYFEEGRTKVIKVKEFSNMNQHQPGKHIEYNIENNIRFKVFDYRCIIYVNPKGRNSSTKDLVFLEFQMFHSDPFYCRFHESINCRAEWTCLTSIVDSEGCLRYPQSFTWMYDGSRKDDNVDFSVQVVSAESLQRDADVLLPYDTLTIQLDMVLKQYHTGEQCKHSTYKELLRSSYEKDRRLRLDSPLGELLREESGYFERLCANPMAEKNSGYLEIAEKDEWTTFLQMVEILGCLHFEPEYFYLGTTVKGIFDVYRMSHFYGIEKVLDTCRCWLGIICRDYFSSVVEEGVSAISQLAETYDDPILRGIVGDLARNQGEIETQRQQTLKVGVKHEQQWTCECDLKVSIDNVCAVFYFKHRAKMEKKQHVTEEVNSLSHCYI